MGYELQVSQVGEAEYPLMAVLRDTIFGEHGHRSAIGFEEMMAGRQDVLALIAHLEGNPVGFKVGFRDGPGVYRSFAGGVLRDYRRQGLGRQMQDWQQRFALSRGYKKIFFWSFNRFAPMLLMGLRDGFLPTAVDARPEGDLAIQFTKTLAEGAAKDEISTNHLSIDAGQAAAGADIVTNGGAVQWTGAGRGAIERTNSAQLISAISAGCEIVGLTQDWTADRASRRFFILFEKPSTDGAGRGDTTGVVA